MGYNEVEGEVTLFPYYDLGAVENFQRKLTSSMEGGATIFFLKKKRKWKYAIGRSYNSCLLFHFDKMYVDTELEYETWCMTPTSYATRSLCEWLKPWAPAQTHSRQWFNEDH